MPNLRLVAWGYFVEIAAAGLILLLLCLALGTTSVVDFVRHTAIDFATLFCAILFGASLAFLWTFYSKGDTEFYSWLDKKGAFNVYLRSTGFVVAISAMTTLVLVTTKEITNPSFSLAAMFLLLLSIINLYTLIQNVFGLMRLNARFNHIRRGNN